MMSTGQIPSLRTILVPLDGSERSERALPVAERLAAAFGSTLLLAQIIEPHATFRDLTGEVMLPQVYQQIAEVEDEVTRRYLTRVAMEARQRGRRVKTHGLRGQPAPTLLDLEESEHVDLVVMASHGAGGAERFAFGSVADRLIRHGKAPALVVRPWGDERRYLGLARARSIGWVRDRRGRARHGAPPGGTSPARGHAGARGGPRLARG
jgi:nucleotide-binding universal stress UspA family protein